MLREAPLPDVLSEICYQYAGMLDYQAYSAVAARRHGVHVPARLAADGPRRQAEFVAGRLCARQALKAAGARRTKVGVDPKRAPRWPEGFVGAITHAEGFIWAAVAPSEHLKGLGIDSERILDADSAQEVQSIALIPAEMDRAHEWVAQGMDLATSTALIFSVKESLYKCLAPRAGRFFELHQAEVCELDPKARRFKVRLIAEVSQEFAQGFALSGRYAVSPGLVHTAIEFK